jgi:hypothetical protein
MKERRKASPSTHSGLPQDYTKMLQDVLSANFAHELEAFKMTSPPEFRASGEIYSDEVVLHLSLLETGKLAATTVHASSDFDPKASSPTVEDLLAICVDAAGDLFSALFQLQPDAEGTPAILSSSLASLGAAPLAWTEVEVQKRKLFVKVDKSNPVLDQAADDWLAKNDPEFIEREKAELEASESLFVVPKKPSSTPHH